MDLLKPDIQLKVNRRQEQQKLNHDHRAKERSFALGDLVYVRNLAQGQPRLSGSIEDERGPVSYTVKLDDGRIQRRHIDHICARAPVAEPDQTKPDQTNWDDFPTPTSSEPDSETDSPAIDREQQDPPTADSSQGSVRCSNHQHSKPDRLSK